MQKIPQILVTPLVRREAWGFTFGYSPMTENEKLLQVSTANVLKRIGKIAKVIEVAKFMGE